MSSLIPSINTLRVEAEARVPKLQPRVRSNSKCSIEFIRLKVEEGKQECVDAQERAFQTIINGVDKQIEEQVIKGDFSPIRISSFRGQAQTSWGKPFMVDATFDNVYRFLTLYKDKQILDLKKSTIDFIVMPWTVHILNMNLSEECQDHTHVHVAVHHDLNLTGNLNSNNFLHTYQDNLYTSSLQEFLDKDMSDIELNQPQLEAQFILRYIDFSFSDSVQ